jgi:hypothetical protein
MGSTERGRMVVAVDLVQVDVIRTEVLDDRVHAVPGSG